MVLLLPATPTASAGVPSSCPGAALRPGAGNASRVDEAILCLINAIRTSHGLQRLHNNRALGRVASSQVGTMLRWDYFSDDRPTGQTPMALVSVSGYSPRSGGFSVGQNIAWGTGRDTTPASIVAAWMASPPHRRIILTGEYHDAGVAVAPGIPRVIGMGRHGAIYAVEFGVRRR